MSSISCGIFVTVESFSPQANVLIHIWRSNLKTLKCVGKIDNYSMLGLYIKANIRNYIFLFIIIIIIFDSVVSRAPILWGCLI